MERGLFGLVGGGCSGIGTMEEGRRILPVVVEVEVEDERFVFMVVGLVEGFWFCSGSGSGSGRGSSSLEKESQTLGPLSINLSDGWLDCSEVSTS